jgi:hypothetical protein
VPVLVFVLCCVACTVLVVMENADSHAPPASTPAAVGAAGAALPIAPQPQSNPDQAVDGAAPAVVAAAAAEPSAAQPLLYAKEFYNTAVPIQQGPPPSEKQWKQARKQGPTSVTPHCL